MKAVAKFVAPLALVLLVFPALAFSQTEDRLLTRAESSGWLETSRHADVMAFMEEVAGRSERIHLTHFGYTNEGRVLPLAVVGDVADASPEAVHASGKVRVYLQGNIHGGEVCGKEALLMLLREIAGGEHDGWFDRLVLLVAPIYNADGNDRIDLGNRPRQHGPLAGMGQRPNAQGLDLNRDHMKVESPEARSLMGMLAAYDPHVAMDLHTTNGSRHAYHLTYAPPLHPGTDAEILGLLRDRWLPTITREMDERHDELAWYYGNLPFGGGTERGWYTFDHRPRFNNNYLGLRNRVAILSEAYSYATFEQRVLATLHFVQRTLDRATEDADAVRELVARVDARSLVGTRLPLRAEIERASAPTDILLGEVAVEQNPYSGEMILRRLEVVEPESMYEFGTFAGTAFETVPAAYYVPAEAAGVLDRLRVHGIRTQALAAETTIDGERFRIAATTVAEREFQGHHERTLEGAWEPARLTLPAGTVKVALDQPGGRLAFYLLEPRSDDGLAAWNFYDESIESAEPFPVVREPAPPQP